MASRSGGTAKRSEADMKRPMVGSWRKHSFDPDMKDEWEEEKREGDEEESEAATGRRAKRERRQGNSGGSAMLCQVCNIRLNSGAQAQIHYRGKTHQRRLRHLSRAANAGAIAQSHGHPLLASMPLLGQTLRAPAQPPLEFKPFMPLRVSGSSPLNLFPNFNAMDPVQKAVINHTFGVVPPKKKTIISCNICHLRFNSTTQAEAHYKGHKHARKLKALDTQRGRHRNGHALSASARDRDKRTGVVLMDTHVADVTGPKTMQAEQGEGSSVAPSTAPQPSPLDASLVCPQLSPEISPGSRLSEPAPESTLVEESSLSPHSDPQVISTGEKEKEEGEGGEVTEAKRSSSKQHLHCTLCKVTVNSTSQLEAHYSGSRHKQMVDGQNGGQSKRRVKVMSSPRPALRAKPWMGSRSRIGGLHRQPYHCELCQLSVNSELQLKQHISSKRHKERLAGKPAKPKFSPYMKIQPSLLATKLALQKHLCKAFPAGFLTNPFSTATLCTFASAHLAMRPQPGPAALLQGPLISPTLFRPAPGPLRATHTPIIFSPY